MTNHRNRFPNNMPARRRAAYEYPPITPLNDKGLTPRAEDRQPGDTPQASPHFPQPTPHGNLLFVFGTLKNPSTRDLMLGRRYREAYFDAVLPGYTKTGMLSIDKAGDNDYVPGLLLTGLSLTDMINLDAYESIYGNGFVGFYARELVDVVISIGRDVNGEMARVLRASCKPVDVRIDDEKAIVKAFAYTTATGMHYPSDRFWG